MPAGVRAGYTAVTVQGDAMDPTYPQGARAFFERIDPVEVGRGDVVLHRTEDGHESRTALRRAIGIGGDHVRQSPGGPVTVNGESLSEPYVKDGDPSGTTPAYDVTVPEGRLFLLVLTALSGVLGALGGLVVEIVRPSAGSGGG
ncbi:signal peptidase I [Streptomyces cinereoruber]|uniref:signal peptidase I n=1 Tax=Streptomyces cinereoruber TaxID=67260 RepID=UPI003641A113